MSKPSSQGVPPCKPKNFISSQGELLLYGPIGEWSEGTDALSVIQELEAVSGEEIKIRIHSQGGSIVEGLAIYNRLLQSTKKVIITIDALAASMASVIAMAGDIVVMPENAWMMIHKPWIESGGNANSLRDQADSLDRLEQDLISIYHRKTGIPKVKLAKMLADETWMNGPQALSLGFIDQILEPVKAAASIDPSKLSLILNKNLTKAGELNMKTLSEKDIADLSDAKATEINDAKAEKAEAKRIIEIQNYGARCKLDSDQIADFIARKLSIEQVRDEAIAELAERSKAQLPSGAFIRMEAGSNHSMQSSKFTTPQASYFAEALSCRHTNIKPSDQARQYMGMSIVDMARSILGSVGEKVWFRNDSAVIAKAMHTTSDFPELLTETGNRILLDAYKSVPSALKTICKKNTARDFRPMSRIKITGDGTLKKVNEGGEYQYGTMFDSAESYKLNTYGQIFSISRQALVNDDLGAFTDSAQILGRVASDFEAQHLVDVLVANPAMSDGEDLFSTAHSNLAASGTVLSIDSLGLGRKGMRLQKSINGKSPVGVAPRYLVVPAALETLSEQILSEIYAATVEEANPFSKKVEILVEPRLDDISETAWYLFADPAQAAVIEYAYLEGDEGPYFESRNGFERDVMEIKLRLDFGAGLLDFRGAYYNEGAGEG